jgi:hypothetical protein
VTSQVGRNPIVTTNPGVKLTDFAAQTLWDVPKTFKDAVDGLLRQDAECMTPDNLVNHFEMTGFRDFLPRWSADDIERARTDGKIPILANWKERLASGQVGLDALMNLNAFYSFVTDQTALDDRIRSLL